jgi:hypothetical protein
VPSQAPIPVNASKANVSAFAENAAHRFGFGAGDPVEPLVSRLGGRIRFRDPIGFESKVPESIVVKPDRTFTIYLPTMTSVERDRFTVAHELGHYFLHYPLVRERDPSTTMIATRWVDENDAAQQRAEWEANWFAAAFLMPSEQFREAHRKFSGNLNRLAGHFVVSTQAADIRIKTLGLG